VSSEKSHWCVSSITSSVRWNS